MPPPPPPMMGGFVPPINNARAGLLGALKRKQNSTPPEERAKAEALRKKREEAELLELQNKEAREAEQKINEAKEAKLKEEIQNAKEKEAERKKAAAEELMKVADLRKEGTKKIDDLNDKVNRVLTNYENQFSDAKKLAEIEVRIDTLVKYKKVNFIELVERDKEKFIIKPVDENLVKIRKELNKNKQEILKQIKQIDDKINAEVPIEGDALKLQNQKDRLLKSLTESTTIFRNEFEPTIKQLYNDLNEFIKAYKDAKKAYDRYKAKKVLKDPLLKVPYNKENAAIRKEITKSDEYKKYQSYIKEGFTTNLALSNTQAIMNGFLDLFKKMKKIRFKIPSSNSRLTTPKYVSSPRKGSPNSDWSPESVSPRVSPERVSPKRVSPKRVPPKQMSPKRVSPKRVSPPPQRVSPKRVPSLTQNEKYALADKIALEKYSDFLRDLPPGRHFDLNTSNTDLKLDKRGYPKLAKQI